MMLSVMMMLSLVQIHIGSHRELVTVLRLPVTINTASKLTHLEVCAPPGVDVEDLDAGDDGEEWRQ